MPDSAPATTRKRRRRRWLIGAIGLFIAATVFGAHYLIQPERLGATLIRRAEGVSGLTILLSTPARLSVWPRLNLQLDGVSVQQALGPANLLTAERVEIALPLAVLWSAEPEIGRIDVRRADIDVAAMMTWMKVDTDAGPPAALRLPEVAAQLQFTESTVRGSGFTLRDVDLRLSALRDGLPATLSLSATSTEISAESWQLTAQATPRQRAQGIRVEAIEMTLSTHSESQPAASLSGELDLQLPQRLRMDLVLTLSHPEQLALPTLPAALQAPMAEPITLSYDGAGDLSAAMKIHAGSQGQLLDITTHMNSLLDWTQLDRVGADGGTPLPPMQGSAKLPNFEFGGVVIEGLQIELTPDSADSPDAPVEQKR